MYSAHPKLIVTVQWIMKFTILKNTFLLIISIYLEVVCLHKWSDYEEQIFKKNAFSLQ